MTLSETKIAPALPVSATTLFTASAAIDASEWISTSAGPPFEWATSDNYLILGTDRRKGWTDWRTDTIILVGLDRANQRAAVFSIPRDMYVQIPGYGWGRINQIDYLGEKSNGEGGGPKLISQVLSATLGIGADHWVRVQMDGFIGFVDAIGGVTVTLDCGFSEPILNLTTGNWGEFTLPAGEVFLDGEDAYWFVRLRLRESDIGRSDRQRQFLWALRDKVLNTNLITRAPELWAAYQNTFSSDMNFFELLDLATFGLGLQAENVRASGLTLADLQDFTTSDGARVLRIANPGYVRAKVANIWNAPAMADSYRRDSKTCQPVVDRSALAPSPAPVKSTNETSTGEYDTSITTVISPTNQTEQAPAAIAEQPDPLPPSKYADSSLTIGNRVRIRKNLSLIVRSQPGDSAGKIVSSMTDGEQAVIIGGPAISKGNGDTIVWWYVRTDSGSEGWAAANTESAALLEMVR